MTSIVVPFRAGGKSRLPDEIRRELALAMLGDVLEAATAVGRVRVVTSEPAAALVAESLGAEAVEDLGDGQGGAVAAVLSGLEGPVLVVNADVPAVRPCDLGALAAAPRRGAASLVEAADGTTNALGLPGPGAFAQLYGPGSAARFRSHFAGLDLVLHELALPGLADDVDTLADLERLGGRAGSRTRSLLAALAT